MTTLTVPSTLKAVYATAAKAYSKPIKGYTYDLALNPATGTLYPTPSPKNSITLPCGSESAPDALYTAEPFPAALHDITAFHIDIEAMALTVHTPAGAFSTPLNLTPQNHPLNSKRPNPVVASIPTTPRTKRALKVAATCMCKDATLPALCNLRLEVQKYANTAKFFTTDRYKVAYGTVEATCDDSAPQLLIPAMMVKLAYQSTAKNLTVNERSAQLEFNKGSHTIVVEQELFEEAYPNLDAIISKTLKGAPVDVEIPQPREFLAALKMLRPTPKQKFFFCPTLGVGLLGTQDRKLKEYVPTAVARVGTLNRGEDCVVGFNPRSLIELLSLVPSGDGVRMRSWSPVKPYELEGINPDVRVIISPLRSDQNFSRSSFDVPFEELLRTSVGR